MKASIQSFLDKEWCVYTARPEPMVFEDLMPFSPENSSEWQAHAFVATLTTDLQKLLHTHDSEKLQAKFQLDVKPTKAQRVVDNFPKKKLILVPLTAKIFTRTTAADLPAHVTILETTFKGDRVICMASNNQMPRETADDEVEGFICPYFAVQTTADEDAANMEVFFSKGASGRCKWPLMRNTRALRKGDVLLIHKESAEETAPDPLQAASPAAAKRRRTKSS